MNGVRKTAKVIQPQIKQTIYGKIDDVIYEWPLFCAPPDLAFGSYLSLILFLFVRHEWGA